MINERESIGSYKVYLVFVERYCQLINLTFEKLEKFMFEKLFDRKNKGQQSRCDSIRCSNEFGQVRGRMK